MAVGDGGAVDVGGVCIDAEVVGGPVGGFEAVADEGVEDESYFLGEGIKCIIGGGAVGIDLDTHSGSIWIDIEGSKPVNNHLVPPTVLNTVI